MKTKTINKRRVRSKQNRKTWTPFIPSIEVKNGRVLETYWNSQVEVNVRDIDDGKWFRDVHGRTPRTVHLSIKNWEKSCEVHDWRTLMRIKAELCGNACFAVEIYPNRMGTVDLVNQFHLWVFEPLWIFPLGFHDKALGITRWENGSYVEYTSYGSDSQTIEDYCKRLKETTYSTGKRTGPKQRVLANHHKTDTLPLIGPVWKLRGF